MSIIQISKMQQRSGNLVDLPQLDEAELGFATDAKQLFIGKETPAENIEVLTSYSNIAFSQLDGSQGNLDISANVADGQALVYDGTNWVNRGGDAGGLITLGDVSNVKITGGAIGYVLETDGIGNLSWTPKGTIIAYIQNVTKANPAVVTTTEDNFFTNSAEVTITNVPGMTELNGNTYYVDVLTANTFALYTSSNLNPSYGVDSTSYNAFPYTSATATTSGTNQVTVGDTTPFSADDPIIFIGDTANSLIIAGDLYYIANVVSGTAFTISDTQGGAEKTLATETMTANVYVPGGRVISLIGGAGGGAAAGGSSDTVQYNKTGILTGDASFTYNDASKLLILNGTANVSNLNTGNFTVTSAISAPQFISTISTGTAPLVVNSTTLVANLAAATAVVATTANVAQTVSNAAQPNITSLGTLTGLIMANTNNINGMYIQGGSNTGAHVSYLVNNRGGDNGILFTIYGNNYSAGSYFNVGADGIAITGNTSAQMAFGTVNANSTLLGANGYAILKLHANGQAEVATPISAAVSLKVNGVAQANTINTTDITTGSSGTLGNITGNWVLTSGSRLQATYADLAEYYVADEFYIPGTVLEFGGDKEVTLAKEGSRKIAGVVSTNPAYVMNGMCTGDFPTLIALIGRVPCKVKGTIKKGDLMVSAGDGYARAESEPTFGSVIGKAIQGFDGVEGVIEIAVGRL